MHRPACSPGCREFRSLRDAGPYAPGGIHLTRKELEVLRAEIERIDSEIVDLISRRKEVASEIGLVKQRDSTLVRDMARERKVVENFRKRATECGVDPKIAAAVAKLLIDYAVRVQEAPTKRDLEGKEALVVGGSGRMGQWTCRRLANRGARVRVFDSRGRLEGYDNVKNLGSAVAGSDIIVIASPPGTCSEDLRQVLECAPKGLVIDICSVKSHISHQLRDAAAKGVKIASAHPMFGPNVPTPRGQTVILCNCGSRTGMSLARRLFSGAGARIFDVDLERHDELMTYVLGLPHLCALLFGASLARSGEPLDELIDAQGPSFSRMMRISEELSRESVRVYHDIQSLNPNTGRMLSSAECALRDLKKASLSKDHGKFKSIMESNRKYLER